MTGVRLEFRLLGPTLVLRDGQAIRLTQGRQQCVLVYLLLNRNRTVSAARLIDELWGAAPPPTAATMLHGYVSRLRRELGGGAGSVDVLRTTDEGYLLEVAEDQIDSVRFEALLEAGRQRLERGDHAGALRALDEAIGCWRGAALADVADRRFARVDADRLEELRLAAEEERVEARLGLGAHGALLGDLQALVERNPLREGLRAQLMLALYRSDRQLEALAVYREARRLFSDDSGSSPASRLRTWSAGSCSRIRLARLPAGRTRGRRPSPRQRDRGVGSGGPLRAAAVVAGARLRWCPPAAGTRAARRAARHVPPPVRSPSSGPRRRRRGRAGRRGPRVPRRRSRRPRHGRVRRRPGGPLRWSRCPPVEAGWGAGVAGRHPGGHGCRGGVGMGLGRRKLAGDACRPRIRDRRPRARSGSRPMGSLAFGAGSLWVADYGLFTRPRPPRTASRGSTPRPGASRPASRSGNPVHLRSAPGRSGSAAPEPSCGSIPPRTGCRAPCGWRARCQAWRSEAATCGRAPTARSGRSSPAGRPWSEASRSRPGAGSWRG